MEALKAKKKKRNRGKKRNLLGEKDDGLQLFSPSRIQTTCNFAYDKEVEKEQQKRDVKEKKKEQQRKKAQEEIKKKHVQMLNLHYK